MRRRNTSCYTQRGRGQHSAALLRKLSKQRYHDCEHSASNQTITLFIYRTWFRSLTTKFQTRNVGPTIRRPSSKKRCTLLSLFQNKERTIIKTNILCRKNFIDLGEVSHLQVHLLGQLHKVIMQSLHETAGKHPSILKKDARNATKFLLPFKRNICQKLGPWLWNKHPR